jgi:preprotein translocase subunit SecA
MVYKEEAFRKFETLLSEIELQVVKTVFAINADTEIKVVRVDDSKLEVKSSDVENMKI